MTHFYKSSLLRPHLRRLRLTSHLSIRPSSTASEKEYAFNYEDLDLKPAEKNVKKEAVPPFVKNLFDGKFNKDFLAYPETLKRERIVLLNSTLTELQKYYAENVKSSLIDKNRKIPNNVLDYLKSKKLFGMTTPIESGGLDYTYTEHAKVLEVLGTDPSVASYVLSRELAYRSLRLYGTETQKDKYLKKLISGELVGAYCLTEYNTGADISAIRTTADPVDDGEWILNGSKTWVANAEQADLLTVFAYTASEDQPEGRDMYTRSFDDFDDVHEVYKKPKDVTCFLIERNLEGITIGEPLKTSGLRGLNVYPVSFNQTRVPAGCVLGRIDGGFDIASNTPRNMRYTSGSLVVGILKDLLAKATDHCINRRLYSRNMMEYGLVQDKISRTAMYIYVIESMVYMTTHLLDDYVDQDAAIENAIVKVFSTEAGLHCVSEIMKLFGCVGGLETEDYERYLRDMRAISLNDCSNDLLKMYISLMGIKYVADGLSNDIFMERNPYTYPKDVLKNVFANFRIANDDPKYTHKLYQFLHHSLEPLANFLEYCVLRFQFSIKHTLIMHGPTIVDQQLPLKKIADVAISLYAQTAVLSRASRAYCIGVQNSDEDVMCAETFVREEHAKVKMIIQELIDGEFGSTDCNVKVIAEKCFKSFGYFAAHPLADEFEDFTTSAVAGNKTSSEFLDK